MRSRSALACAATAALVVVVSGCSVKEGHHVDLVAGKKLFVERCGSCHTLARAGTKGTIGPNLDDAFREDVREHFGEGAIRGVVRGQIKAPNSAGAMPANVVTGNDAQNVAAYVAHVAAQPGKDTGLLASATGGSGGRALFTSNGCSSCHTLSAAAASGTVGPDLDRALSGRDQAFIRTSIVSPDAYIAPGYKAGVMPKTFAKSLKPSQLRALVNFLYKATHK